jgi:hypothetical protein
MGVMDTILNKEKFLELESKIPPVNNTLTSTSTKEGLSAYQGKVLNDKAVNLNTNLSNYTTLQQYNNLNSIVTSLNTTVNTTLSNYSTTINNLNTQINNLNNQINSLNFQLSSANATINNLDSSEVSFGWVGGSSISRTRYPIAPYKDNFLCLVFNSADYLVNSFNKFLQKGEKWTIDLPSASYRLMMIGKYPISNIQTWN